MGGAVGVPVPALGSSAGTVGPVSTVLSGVPLCAVEIWSADCGSGVAPGNETTLSVAIPKDEVALSGVLLAATGATCSAGCTCAVTSGNVGKFSAAVEVAGETSVAASTPIVVVVLRSAAISEEVLDGSVGRVAVVYSNDRMVVFPL
jgi:hypothetical protein